MLSLSTRSRTFNDIVGQKNIIRGFKESSKKMKFQNIMLMEGNTGTGKTTTALLIAQLLNCSSPIKEEDGSYSPCQECASCKDIINEQYNRDVDIVNCSKVGKDDISELENQISFAPRFDRNKIIILDEVQELYKKAKSSLLLFLEKTYKNVYIILTTMNIKEIDKSIISRTIPYKFKDITSSDISSHLFSLLKKEKLETSKEFIEDGIFTISEYSEGSIRMALQYLERCIESKLFTSKEINDEFGFMTVKDNFNLLSSLLKKEPSFFREFQKVDQEYFFNMAWKNLTELAIYCIDKNIISDADYRSRYFSKLESDFGMERILSLHEIFESVFRASYIFNPKYFSSRLVSYYSQR
jgi:DNA polymerase-3 subunit gamma/tau